MLIRCGFPSRSPRKVEEIEAEKGLFGRRPQGSRCLLWEVIIQAATLRVTSDVLVYSKGSFSSFLVLPFINPKINILRAKSLL